MGVNSVSKAAVSAPPPPPPPAPRSPPTAGSTTTHPATARSTTPSKGKSGSPNAAVGGHQAAGSTAERLAQPNSRIDALRAEPTGAERLRGEADKRDTGATTLGSVAGARAVDRLRTTPQGLTDAQLTDTSKIVHGKAQDMGLGKDVVAQGSRAAGTAKPTSDLDLGIRVGPEKFNDFLNNQSKLSSPNPGSSAARTRDYSIENGIIQRGEARLSPTGKALEGRLGMDVDLSVIRKGGNFDNGATMAVPTTRGMTARAAGQGALVGAATDATFATAAALKDGRISGDEAKGIAMSSARGAGVGATQAVTERGLINAADRFAGGAIERTAASTAAKLGAADAATLGTGARVVGTRLGGAGAAGAVVSAGLSIYQNRDGLARGDSEAIGRVAGDAVVGAGSALAGAAAGAAIGSVVPGVGTVVGAVVGLGAGAVADYVLRAGGVDKAIGNLVTSGVDAAKGAVGKVAGWLGW